jgi:hypothetical protein
MPRRVSASTALLALAAAALASVLLSGLLSSARASEPGLMLPNLVADPPNEAQLTTSSIEGRSRLLLRFSGYLHNDGEGALDIRGSRAEPVVRGKDAGELKQQVMFARLAEETLPQALEEELTVPAMKAEQRIFQVKEIRGRPEESLEREHIEREINAQILYSNADGHHHWHLQHIARYSLWNASRTAEVAPAQKVGFCLTDSQHVEPEKGPSTAVYSDNEPPYESFCRHFEPNATSLYEGISPGWRDRYGNELAFQWVDASDVSPGEYWLREDVDPERVLEEEGGGNKHEYAAEPTIIPGFVADPESIEDREGEPVKFELGVQRYDDESQPLETIVSPPAHGTLSHIEGGRLTYTPKPGYSGTDSFSFAASDPDSQFPESPPVAEVSISVASQQATISIGGAQQTLVAGTSEQLTAAVSHDNGAVEWEASAGTVTPSGEGGRQATYTAPSVPPPSGSATVTAHLHDHPSISASVSIAVSPIPTPVPQPEPPPEPVSEPPPAGTGPASPGTGTTDSETGTTSSGTNAGTASSTDRSAGTTNSVTGTPSGTSGASGEDSAASLYLARTGGVEAPPGDSSPAATAAALSAPRAMLVAHELVITIVPRSAGRISISASLDGRGLGGCSALTTAGRLFSCRVRLRAGVSTRAPIAILAELRSGAHLWQLNEPPREVPVMVMRPIGNRARAASASSGFWCSPGTLVAELQDQPAS